MNIRYFKLFVLKFCLIGFLFLFSNFVYCQKAEIISLEKLQHEIENDSEKILVFNFWATWCGPCIKELPMFEKLNRENSNIKITLVSMDLDLNPNPQKVYDFVSKKKLKSRVVILEAGDPNSWIETIDANWSGALPATLVVNTVTGNRRFVNSEIDLEELENLIKEVQ